MLELLYAKKPERRQAQASSQMTTDPRDRDPRNYKTQIAASGSEEKKGCKGCVEFDKIRNDYTSHISETCDKKCDTPGRFLNQ